MPRSTLLPLAAIATLLAPAAASAAPAPTLFVQSADSAVLKPLGGDRYRLVLDPVERGVTSFADRPARQAAQESVAAFVDAWRERGFAADPPNAALVVDDGPRRADTMVLTLARPRLRGDRLVYRARRIRAPATGALARHGRRDDPSLPRRLGDVHLFVDDAAAAQALDVTLQLQSPGQIRVTFDDTAQIVLGTGTQGAEWASNAGGGFLTTTTASITGAQVPGAIGGLLSFTVQSGGGPLTGTATVSPSGAVATLQLGDAAPVPLTSGRFSIPTG